MVRVAMRADGTNPIGSRWLRHRSSYGYDSLASFGRQQFTIPIAIFRQGTGDGFLPRRTAGTIKSRRLSNDHLRVHASDAEGLAETRRTDRRTAHCDGYMAFDPTADQLRLRPDIIRRTCH